MKKALIAFSLILLAYGANANVCVVTDPDYDPIDCAALGSGANGNPGNPGNATAVPVDGGASLLLAGGIAMGSRKLRALKKARAEKAAKNNL